MAVFETNREEVEATKLAVRRLDVHSISSRRTLVKCIRMMLDLYDRDHNMGYLYAAVARIQAYLELGFCYDDEAELFDQILSLAGSSKIEQFPRRAYAAKRICPTRAQIGGIIKRWHGNVITKNQVIDDIIEKIESNCCGTFEYRNTEGVNKRTKECVYILYLDDEEKVLYDVDRDIFYTFDNGQG